MGIINKNIITILLVSTLILTGVYGYQAINKSNTIEVAVLYADSYSEKEIDGLLDIIKDDTHEYFKNEGLNYRFKFLTLACATANNTEGILKKLQSYGINIVIGFDYSYQLERVIDYASEHDIILISPYSSSTQLCKIKPNVYRMKPNGTHQTKIISSYLREKGIKSAIIINQNETWPNSFSNKIVEDLEKGPIKYTTYKYESVNETVVNHIEASVSDLTANYNLSEIVIVHFGVFDLSEIASKLDTQSNAVKVQWIGMDAFVSKMVLENDNENIIKTFRQIPLICFTQAPNISERYNNVNDRYMEITGNMLDYEQCARYDAVYMIAKIIGQIQSFDVHQINQNLPYAAKQHNGLLGNCTFNINNDRINSNYWIMGLNVEKNMIEPIGYFNATSDKIN